MKNKKINLDMLENADTELLEQLSEEDKLTEAEKDRMFELSIKYFYGEIQNSPCTQKNDVKAEVRNSIFFGKNKVLAAVFLLVFINTAVIGALKLKDNNDITEHRKGEEYVVSAVTSESKKESPDITSLSSSSESEKEKNNDKENVTANIHESVTVINTVTENHEAVSESSTKPYDERNEEQKSEPEEKKQINEVTVTEAKVSVTEAKTSDDADIQINTDELVTVLASQNFVPLENPVKSDISFSQDENTTYFIRNNGSLWKTVKNSGSDMKTYEAKLSDEDMEVVNDYLEKYGSLVFKIYPVDTDYLTMILDSLSYGSLSGKGRPEYSFSPDEKVIYEIDTENRLVWRKSEGPDGEIITEEAILTVDAYSAAEKCIATYGQSLFNWL